MMLFKQGKGYVF